MPFFQFDLQLLDHLSFHRYPQHRSRFIWLAIFWFCFHGIDPFSCSLKVVSSQGKQNCPSFSIKAQTFKWLGPAQVTRGFPGGSDGEESSCSAGDPGSIPGLGRSPGEENGNPLQDPCLEKSHGQRSLVGCNPWGSKESGTTERLT